MTMRMAGITGMFDTDAMVKAQLEPYKLKVQTKTQERDLLELKQKQYRNVLKDIKDFYNKYISTSKSDSLMLSSSYKSVKFAASNGSTAVTATANSTASISNYNVSVSQLASSATTTFSEAYLQSKVNPASGAASGVLYINSGASATGSDVYVDIASDVKKDSSGSYVDINGKKIIKQSDNITFKYADGTAVASGDIQYEADMKKTADNLNSKLSAGNLGIKATYSEFSKGIVLESTEMGSNVKFSAMYEDFSDAMANSGDNTAAINASQLTTTQKTYIKTTANATSGYIFSGKNLNAQITKVTNGISSVYNISDTDNVTNVNNKTIDGVTFQFNDKTANTSLTGTKDVTAIKDKIVSFVNDYNTLITNLNTKLLEKRDKNYVPLTDEQKKDMSDDDIKLWNEKVNTGLVRKDNDLQRIVNEMKSSMRTLISDSGLKLENIGITPINNYTTLNGTFMVNEDKLTNALENNMDGVKGLFLKDTNNSQDYESNGILTSLKSIVETEVTSSSAPLVKKMGLEGSISDETSLQLDKMKTQLEEMNQSLTTRENNLYTKYANLESAMNSIQSQQTWLSQQFS